MFDGDYATTTFAISADDPLQACAVAFQANYVNDPYVMRRAAAMARRAGFVDGRVRSHGYVQVEDPAYMQSVVDRGADALAAAGTLDSDGAAALKAEARRRVAHGVFFGHIAYLSVIAHKP
jgi:arsenite methyltransferase